MLVGCARASGDEDINEVPLRPLTSLKWPYVPEESAYPDPLKRDDPKPLQLTQYEAIGSYRHPYYVYRARSVSKKKPCGCGCGCDCARGPCDTKNSYVA